MNNKTERILFHSIMYLENLFWNYNLLPWLMTMQNSIHLFQVQGTMKEQIKLFN